MERYGAVLNEPLADQRAHARVQGLTVVHLPAQRKRFGGTTIILEVFKAGVEGLFRR